MMDAARVIRKKKDQIVEDWLKLLKKEIPEVKEYKKSAIENDVPDLLDALVQALEEGNKEPLLNAGKEHGEQRVSFKNYSLVHVIREYRLLRKIIFITIDEDGEIKSNERDKITFAIDQAIEQGCDHYFQLEKQKMMNAAKEAEQNLEQLKADDRLRDNFISSLSHDLNNPITAIKMVVQLMENGSNVEDREKLLNIIKVSALKAERLINDLLDVNLVNSGAELPLEILKCDLLKKIKESVDSYKFQYGDIIQLNTDLRELYVNVDCDALQRALDNLVDNAIKYGDNDKPVIIEFNKKDSNINISVLNYGNYIPLSEQAHIFSRFYRIKSTSAKKSKGWGIGLSLIKGIAEAHGGKVSVDSTKGHGTKFTIAIPENTVKT